MDKIDYGDFHKFLASLGLALVVLAFLIPWLFLREPFDLQFETSKLQNLTEEARSLILYRQRAAITLVRLLPWVSVVLGLVGLRSLYVGLRGWAKRQKVVDSKQEADLKKVQKEIEKMSEVDLKEKQESESLEGEESREKGGTDGTGEDVAGVGLEPRKAPRLNRYGRIEALLLERLTTCLQDEYFVRPHQQLGTAQFDLILQPKAQGAEDLVVEVKFSDYRLDWRYVRANLIKAVYLNELYSRALRRRSLPVLYFIAPEAVLLESDTEGLERRSRSEAKRLGVEVGLKFISEETLPSRDCRELTTALYVGAKHGRASA